MRPITTLCVLLSAATATAQWSVQATTTSPTSRNDAMMAFDLARGQTVLFGGSAVGGIALRNDTWTYDGSDWAQAAPANSPTGRFGAGLVFDQARNVLVLFGGIASAISIAAPSNQTWEWNGTDWTQVTPTASPTGRAYFGMTYDIARQRTVVFGGSTNPGLLVNSNQTWEYDGTTWVQAAMTSAANPGALQFPAMAYHAGLAQTVLFGGINPHTGGNNNTWLFDGTTWTQAPVITSPPGIRNMPKMVYDTFRSTCVMHGGSDPALGTPINETWEFDGAVWRQVNAAMPSPRIRFAMAHDMLAGKPVLFGGSANNTALLDTWEYGAFVADLGAGCPGSNGVPALAGTTEPRLGSTFVSTMTNLANGTGLGAIVAGFTANNPPVPLAPFGLPGCSLHTNVDAMLFLPVLGGAMTASMALPADPTLVGLQIHEQGLSLDPGFNPAGMVVSNAITANLGW